MATEVGTAYITILPSTRGFRDRLSRDMSGGATDAGRRAGGSFSAGFVKVASGLLAGGAVVGILKDSIGLASDLAEGTSKAAVVFGKSQGLIIKASKTSASAMGLSSKAYIDAAGNLGNLFVALKLPPAQAATMSKSMVQLAADMASFNNTSIEDALAAIQSGLVGETEPLRKYGVNMNDATLRAEALKLGLIATVKDALTPQTKALAANALIMEQTKTAHGDFARTSSGLANQQRILTARWEDAKTKLGTGLLPVMLGIVSFVSDRVIPAFDKLGSFIDGSAGGMGRIGSVVKTTVLPALKGLAAWFTSTILPSIRDVASAFRDTLLPVLGFLGGALKGVLPALEQVAGFIVHRFAEAWTILTTLFVDHILPIFREIVTYVKEQLGPVWHDVVDVVNNHLVPAFKAVARAVGETIDKFIRPAVTWLLARLGDVISFLRAVLVPVLSAVFDFIKANANWLVPLVTGIGAFIVAWKLLSIVLAMNPFVAIAIAVIAIGTLIYKNWNTIKAFFVNTWATIKKNAIDAWNTIKAFFAGIAAWFVRLWQNVTGAIKTAWNAILGFFKSIVTAIVRVFTNSLNWLVTAGKNIISGLWNGIKFIWITVSTFFVHIGTTIVNWFGNAINWLINAGRNILKGLWNGITGIWSGVVAWFARLPGRIGDFFVNAAKWLINAGVQLIRGLITGMVDFLSAPIRVFGPVGDLIVGGLKKVLGIKSPSTRMIPVGRMVAKGLIEGIARENPEAAAVKIFGSMPAAIAALFKSGRFTLEDIMAISNPKFKGATSSLLAGIGVGAGASGADYTGGGQISDWIARALAWTKTSMSWAPALYGLIMHESGGNPNIQNNWDRNAVAGTPSIGLAQVIAPTFAAYRDPRLPNNLRDPIANLVAAINYIKARYSDIFHIASYAGGTTFVGGYAAGTHFVPETGLAMVHQGEAIVPAGANSGWGGPSVLVLVDSDGRIIERIRVEAANEIDAQMAATASSLVYGRSG